MATLSTKIRNSLLATAIALPVATGYEVAVANWAAVAQTVPKAKPPQKVSGQKISALIRGTMIALNHANQTGNYTVLRDLGSSGFRSENSAAGLGDVFHAFRETNVDLGDTVLLDPRLVGSPKLTKSGELRLKGLFLTKPENVTFDLTYFFEAGAWRIANLTIGFHTHQEDAAAAARKRDSNSANSQ